MRATIKMPKVADSVDTVTVIEWECAVGEPVTAGEVFVRVETDKAIVDVPAPISGTVLELLVGVDDDVTTGTPIVVVDA